MGMLFASTKVLDSPLSRSGIASHAAELLGIMKKFSRESRLSLKLGQQDKKGQPRLCIAGSTAARLLLAAALADES